MLETTTQVRALTAADVPILRELPPSIEDPLVNLFVRGRVDASRLQTRWLGGEIWGYFEDDQLVSACHAGANIVPVQATPRGLSRRLPIARSRENMRPSSIVGPRSAVEPMWEILEPHWGPARSPRLDQPFMVLEHVIRPSGQTRACGRSRLTSSTWSIRPVSRCSLRKSASTLKLATATATAPASPSSSHKVGRSRSSGTARCCSRLKSARQPPMRASFKVSTYALTCEDRGIAAAAVAAVVEQVRASVAPSVTLYVNGHNIPARRAYERVGFEHTETFASILF